MTMTPNRHPNRKQFSLRLSAPERDALLDVLKTAIARLIARGRSTALLQRLHDKLATIGKTAPRDQGQTRKDDPNDETPHA